MNALRTAAAAALLALGPWRAPAAQADHGGAEAGGAAVDGAIAAGVEYLLACQEIDGSWRYRGGPHVGRTALNLLALVKSRVPREHHAVQRALVWLGERIELEEVGATYDAGLVLMVLAAHDRDLHRRPITEVQRALLEWQGGEARDGGFGYGPEGGRADLSNTQYAALGLHAAETCDVQAPARAWRELAEFALACRHDSGGFAYLPDGGAPTGSMTAAGVAIAILALEHLEARQALGAGLRAELERARDGGIAWIARNFDVARNPGGGWHHYWLYGLERVGAFAGLARFGEREWYREGAELLVRSQRPTGGWDAGWSPNDSDTAFALLFLTRASAPVTGVEGRTAGKVYGTPGDAGELILVAAGDANLEMWINGFPEAARARYEFPGEEGRGPRAVRAEFLADGRVVAEIEGDPALPASEQRFAASHAFDEPGVHTVQARLLVRDPSPRPGSATAWLTSPVLEVPVEEVLPAWERDAALDTGRNLLAGIEIEFEASSEYQGSPEALGPRHVEGFGASHVADGVQSSSWLCAEGDAEPRVVLKLAERVFADRVLLSHARTLPLRPGALSRALEVEVSVDARHRVRALMNPDPARKTVIELGGMQRVRGLEVRVVSSVPGTATRTAVGFAEIELQLSGRER